MVKLQKYVISIMWHLQIGKCQNCTTLKLVNYQNLIGQILKIHIQLFNFLNSKLWEKMKIPNFEIQNWENT